MDECCKETAAAIAGPVLALAAEWATTPNAYVHHGSVLAAAWLKATTDLRAAIPTDATEALSRLKAQWQAEERERIAQAIEGMQSFAHGKNPTSEAHLLGYGTARRLAARIARVAQQDGGSRG